MELPIASPNIEDFLLIYVSHESLPPYDVLFLMAVLLGIACWFSSMAIKQIRKEELLLKRKVKKLDRQHRRDNKEIHSLKHDLDKLMSDKDAKEKPSHKEKAL
jgi:hypothetical protein